MTRSGVARARGRRVRCSTVVRIGRPDGPVRGSSATHCRTGRGRRRSSRPAHIPGVRLRKSAASQGHQRCSQNDPSHCSFSPSRVHSRHNGLPAPRRSDKLRRRGPRNCALMRSGGRMAAALKRALPGRAHFSMRLLRDHTQCRTRGRGQVAVERQIVLRHASGAEALLEATSHRPAR